MSGITATRYHLPATLYAPLRVVLYERDGGGSTSEYDKISFFSCSSAMNV
ncbi:MAG TPA: hypothetical protein VG848_02010 [Acetobacteraceae bacterium]|nr:hypothetical protein [Acetobacteraceae bacterium]